MGEIYSLQPCFSQILAHAAASIRFSWKMFLSSETYQRSLPQTHCFNFIGNQVQGFLIY